MTVSLCIRQGSKRNDDSVSVEELDWSAERQVLIPAEHLWCDFTFSYFTLVSNAEVNFCKLYILSATARQSHFQESKWVNTNFNSYVINSGSRLWFSSSHGSFSHFWFSQLRKSSVGLTSREVNGRQVRLQNQIKTLLITKKLWRSVHCTMKFLFTLHLLHFVIMRWFVLNTKPAKTVDLTSEWILKCLWLTVAYKKPTDMSVIDYCSMLQNTLK